MPGFTGSAGKFLLNRLRGASFHLLQIFSLQFVMPMKNTQKLQRHS